MVAVPTLDLLHYGLMAVIGVLAWYAKSRFAPAGSPPAPLPDFVPDHPVINRLLKEIVQKLIDEVPLPAVEAKLAAAFKAQIAAKYPQLASLIDQLSGLLPAVVPTKPAS